MICPNTFFCSPFPFTFLYESHRTIFQSPQSWILKTITRCGHWLYFVILGTANTHCCHTSPQGTGSFHGAASHATITHLYLGTHSPPQDHREYRDHHHRASLLHDGLVFFSVSFGHQHPQQPFFSASNIMYNIRYISLRVTDPFFDGDGDTTFKVL